MAENIIRPFLCDNLEKSVLRREWENWLRAFKIYLEVDEIKSAIKKRTKLLHLGSIQLQTVPYALPGAIVEFDEEEEDDVFAILVDKLTKYFSPKQNSTFERHLFRKISPDEGEDFGRFILRLRQQIRKCSFGSTKAEMEEICLKDKIIDTWASSELKKKLLEKEHTLGEVIEACQVDEEISKQSQLMLAKP